TAAGRRRAGRHERADGGPGDSAGPRPHGRDHCDGDRHAQLARSRPSGGRNRARGAELDGSDGRTAGLPADRPGGGTHHGACPAARGEVDVQGRYVTAEEVRLDTATHPVPPVLAGVRGPKSMALAGRASDGVLLADCAGPSFLPAARAQAGDPPGFQVHVFAPLITAPTRREAYQKAAGWLAEQLAAPTPSLRQMSFYAELVELAGSGGPEKLAEVPSQWWAELGAIGTLEDAAAHIEALEAA